MVRVYSHKPEKKQKKQKIQMPHREVIDFHSDDISLLIHKIYNAVNKDDVCAFCKKPSKYVRVVIDDMKKVYAFKICRQCLMKK